jgi:hypothetical protein
MILNWVNKFPVIEVDKSNLKGNEKLADIGHKMVSCTEFLHGYELDPSITNGKKLTLIDTAGY